MAGGEGCRVTNGLRSLREAPEVPGVGRRFTRCGYSPLTPVPSPPRATGTDGSPPALLLCPLTVQVLQGVG